MTETVTQPKLIAEPVYQYSLFDDTKTQQVINVASVPQRSPFRYPGGKTWLIPRIRQWLTSMTVKPCELIEPFAGGASVSLTAACEKLVLKATMVELDEQVALVWKAILNGHGEWLSNRITTFDFTSENVESTLSDANLDTQEQAFKTILRNRINHGGILAPGSGRLKYGENGRGLSSRWYPQTLSKRILNIINYKERLRLIEGDGLQVMRDNADRTDAVFFIDPPYTAGGKKAGSRLYTYSELNHEELFHIASTLKGEFLMTYDNAEDVKSLARKHNFEFLAIPMKNTHHAEMTELIISRRLDWV